MSYVEIFRYEDKTDLIKQLDARMTELLGDPPMTPYAEVRARYPHLKTTTFSMRLKRFPGTFPHHREGKKSRRITELFVTQALDAWLRK